MESPPNGTSSGHQEAVSCYRSLEGTLCPDRRCHWWVHHCGVTFVAKHSAFKCKELSRIKILGVQAGMCLTGESFETKGGSRAQDGRATPRLGSHSPQDLPRLRLGVGATLPCPGMRCPPCLKDD